MKTPRDWDKEPMTREELERWEETSQRMNAVKTALRVRTDAQVIPAVEKLVADVARLDAEKQRLLKE
jgi:hypothetical protein